MKGDVPNNSDGKDILANEGSFDKTPDVFNENVYSSIENLCIGCLGNHLKPSDSLSSCIYLVCNNASDERNTLYAKNLTKTDGIQQLQGSIISIDENESAEPSKGKIKNKVKWLPYGKVTARKSTRIHKEKVESKGKGLRSLEAVKKSSKTAGKCAGWSKAVNGKSHEVKTPPCTKIVRKSRGFSGSSSPVRNSNEQNASTPVKRRHEGRLAENGGCISVPHSSPGRVSPNSEIFEKQGSKVSRKTLIPCVDLNSSGWITSVNYSNAYKDGRNDQKISIISSEETMENAASVKEVETATSIKYSKPYDIGRKRPVDGTTHNFSSLSKEYETKDLLSEEYETKDPHQSEPPSGVIQFSAAVFMERSRASENIFHDITLSEETVDKNLTEPFTVNRHLKGACVSGQRNVVNYKALVNSDEDPVENHCSKVTALNRVSICSKTFSRVDTPGVSTAARGIERTQDKYPMLDSYKGNNIDKETSFMISHNCPSNLAAEFRENPDIESLSSKGICSCSMTSSCKSLENVLTPVLWLHTMSKRATEFYASKLENLPGHTIGKNEKEKSELINAKSNDLAFGEKGKIFDSILIGQQPVTCPESKSPEFVNVMDECGSMHLDNDLSTVTAFQLSDYCLTDGDNEYGKINSSSAMNVVSGKYKQNKLKTNNFPLLQDAVSSANFPDISEKEESEVISVKGNNFDINEKEISGSLLISQQPHSFKESMDLMDECGSIHTDIDSSTLTVCDEFNVHYGTDDDYGYGNNSSSAMSMVSVNYKQNEGKTDNFPLQDTVPSANFPVISDKDESEVISGKGNNFVIGEKEISGSLLISQQPHSSKESVDLMDECGSVHTDSVCSTLTACNEFSHYGTDDNNECGKISSSSAMNVVSVNCKQNEPKTNHGVTWSSYGTDHAGVSMGKNNSVKLSKGDWAPLRNENSSRGCKGAVSSRIRRGPCIYRMFEYPPDQKILFNAIGLCCNVEQLVINRFQHNQDFLRILGRGSPDLGETLDHQKHYPWRILSYHAIKSRSRGIIEDSSTLKTTLSPYKLKEVSVRLVDIAKSIPQLLSKKASIRVKFRKKQEVDREFIPNLNSPVVFHGDHLYCKQSDIDMNTKKLQLLDTSGKKIMVSIIKTSKINTHENKKEGTHVTGVESTLPHLNKDCFSKMSNSINPEREKSSCQIIDENNQTNRKCMSSKGSQPTTSVIHKISVTTNKDLNKRFESTFLHNYSSYGRNLWQMNEIPYRSQRTKLPSDQTHTDTTLDGITQNRKGVMMINKENESTLPNTHRSNLNISMNTDTWNKNCMTIRSDLKDNSLLEKYPEENTPDKDSQEENSTGNRKSREFQSENSMGGRQSWKENIVKERDSQEENFLIPRDSQENMDEIYSNEKNWVLNESCDENCMVEKDFQDGNGMIEREVHQDESAVGSNSCENNVQKDIVEKGSQEDKLSLKRGSQNNSFAGDCHLKMPPEFLIMRGKKASPLKHSSKLQENDPASKCCLENKNKSKVGARGDIFCLNASSRTKSVPISSHIVNFCSKPQAIGTCSELEIFSICSEPQVVGTPSEPQIVGTHSEPQINGTHSEPQIVGTHSEPQIISTHSEGQIVGTHSEPQIIGTYSELQIVGTHSEPQIIGTHSEPQIVGTHSEPQIIGTHSEPQVVGTHSEPQIVGTHSESQIIGTHFEPQIVGTHSEPQIIGTHSEPQIIGTHSEPQIVGTHSEPQIVGTHSEPQIIGTHSEPQVVGTQSEPQIVGTHSEPQVVGTHSEPQIVGTHSEPQIVGTHSEPQIVGIHSEPQIIGTHYEPQIVGTQSEPQIIGTHSEPQVVGTCSEAHVVGTHFEPQIIGTLCEPQITGTHSEPQVVGTCSEAHVVGTLSEPQIIGTHSEPQITGTHSEPQVVGTCSEAQGLPGKNRFYLDNLINMKEKCVEDIDTAGCVSVNCVNKTLGACSDSLIHFEGSTESGCRQVTSDPCSANVDHKNAFDTDIGEFIDTEALPNSGCNHHTNMLNSSHVGHVNNNRDKCSSGLPSAEVFSKLRSDHIANGEKCLTDIRNSVILNKTGYIQENMTGESDNFKSVGDLPEKCSNMANHAFLSSISTGMENGKIVTFDKVFSQADVSELSHKNSNEFTNSFSVANNSSENNKSCNQERIKPNSETKEGSGASPYSLMTFASVCDGGFPDVTKDSCAQVSSRHIESVHDIHGKRKRKFLNPVVRLERIPYFKSKVTSSLNNEGAKRDSICLNAEFQTGSLQDVSGLEKNDPGNFAQKFAINNYLCKCCILKREKANSGTKKFRGEKTDVSTKKSRGEKSDDSTKKSRGEKIDDCTKKSRGEKTDDSTKKSSDEMTDDSTKKSRGKKSDDSTKESRGEKTDDSRKKSRGKKSDGSTKMSSGEKTDDFTKKSRDEKTDDSTQESRDEKSDDSTKMSRGEKTDDSTKKSKDEKTDDSTQESRDEKSDDSTKMSRGEKTDDSTKKSRDEKTDGSTKMSRGEKTDDSTKMSRGESTDDSTMKSRDEKTGDSRKKSRGEKTDDSRKKSRGEKSDGSVMSFKSSCEFPGVPAMLVKNNLGKSVECLDKIRKFIDPVVSLTRIKIPKSGDTINLKASTNSKYRSQLPKQKPETAVICNTKSGKTNNNKYSKAMQNCPYTSDVNDCSSQNSVIPSVCPENNSSTCAAGEETSVLDSCLSSSDVLTRSVYTNEKNGRQSSVDKPTNQDNDSSKYRCSQLINTEKNLKDARKSIILSKSECSKKFHPCKSGITASHEGAVDYKRTSQGWNESRVKRLKLEDKVQGMLLCEEKANIVRKNGDLFDKADVLDSDYTVFPSELRNSAISSSLSKDFVVEQSQNSSKVSNKDKPSHGNIKICSVNKRSKFRTDWRGEIIDAACQPYVCIHRTNFTTACNFLCSRCEKIFCHKTRFIYHKKFLCKGRDPKHFYGCRICSAVLKNSELRTRKSSMVKNQYNIVDQKASSSRNFLVDVLKQVRYMFKCEGRAGLRETSRFKSNGDSVSITKLLRAAKYITPHYLKIYGKRKFLEPKDLSCRTEKTGSYPVSANSKHDVTGSITDAKSVLPREQVKEYLQVMRTPNNTSSCSLASVTENNDSSDVHGRGSLRGSQLLGREIHDAGDLACRNEKTDSYPISANSKERDEAVSLTSNAKRVLSGEQVKELLGSEIHDARDLACRNEKTDSYPISANSKERDEAVSLTSNAKRVPSGEQVKELLGSEIHDARDLACRNEKTDSYPISANSKERDEAVSLTSNAKRVLSGEQVKELLGSEIHDARDLACRNEKTDSYPISANSKERDEAVSPTSNAKRVLSGGQVKELLGSEIHDARDLACRNEKTDSYPISANSKERDEAVSLTSNAKRVPSGEQVKELLGSEIHDARDLACRNEKTDSYPISANSKERDEAVSLTSNAKRVPSGEQVKELLGSEIHDARDLACRNEKTDLYPISANSKERDEAVSLTSNAKRVLSGEQVKELQVMRKNKDSSDGQERGNVRHSAAEVTSVLPEVDSGDNINASVLPILNISALRESKSTVTCDAHTSDSKTDFGKKKYLDQEKLPSRKENNNVVTGSLISNSQAKSKLPEHSCDSVLPRIESVYSINVPDLSVGCGMGEDDNSLLPVTKSTGFWIPVLPVKEGTVTYGVTDIQNYAIFFKPNTNNICEISKTSSSVLGNNISSVKSDSIEIKEEQDIFIKEESLAVEVVKYENHFPIPIIKYEVSESPIKKRVLSRKDKKSSKKKVFGKKASRARDMKKKSVTYHKRSRVSSRIIANKMMNESEGLHTIRELRSSGKSSINKGLAKQCKQ